MMKARPIRPAVRATVLLPLLAALLLSPTGAAATTPGLPEVLVNGGMERGEPGAVPVGWQLAEGADGGYQLEITGDGEYEGAACATLRYDGSGAGDSDGDGDGGGGDHTGTARASQQLDATPWRGQEMRLTALLRVTPWSQARLRLEAISADGQVVAFDDMAADPVTSGSWWEGAVTGRVPEDADRLIVSVLLDDTQTRGGGQLWVDQVVLRPLGVTGDGIRGPRRISEEGIANLLAFARLLGYVRYFYPGDEAAAADWEALALEGVEAMEDAAGPDELARRLTLFFWPLAPAIQLYPTPPIGSGAPPPAAPRLMPPGVTPARHLAWLHHGLGGGLPGSPFRSERVAVPEPGSASGTASGDLSAEAAEVLPAIDEAYVINLPGGVSCRLPLALPADDEGTYPRFGSAPGERAPTGLPGGKPEGFEPTSYDRTSRMATLILAWNALQHFYPYFGADPMNRTSVDWQVALHEALRQTALDNGPEEFRIILERFVARLNDGQARLSWQGGRGASLPPVDIGWVEDELLVTRVAGEAEGRLQPGDRIVAIDGVWTSEILVRSTARISAATPQRLHWRLRERLLRGDEGSPLSLTVLRGDSRQRVAGPEGDLTATVVRRGEAGVDPGRPQQLAELAPGVLYVDLTRLTADRLDEVRDRLAGAAGILFDVRGQLSADALTLLFHLSDEALTTVRNLVPLVAYPDRKRLAFEGGARQLPPAAPRWTDNVAFLTDGRAIGPAEVLLAVVEAHYLGEIVGSATAGTIGTVNRIDLPCGFAIDFTGSKAIKPNETRHHGAGVQPTIEIDPTRAGVSAGRDEVLERALAAVAAGLGDG